METVQSLEYQAKKKKKKDYLLLTSYVPLGKAPTFPSVKWGPSYLLLRIAVRLKGSHIKCPAVTDLTSSFLLLRTFESEMEIVIESYKGHRT